MNCKFTNRGFINVLVFAAGAAIGSAVTWKILETKYERIVQEEIESVKEAFIGLNNDDDKTDESSESDDEEDTSDEYHQVNWDELEDLDEDEDDELEEYADLTNLYSSEKGGAEKVEVKKPYVIDPIEFGERDGFKQVSLTYYSDHILADESDNIITDVDELIGAGSLDTFGDYEDDSVFVRNEQLRVDFEILKDYNTYEEATGVSPEQVSNE